MLVSLPFIAILMTILIQGTTTKWLAAKLGLIQDPGNLKRASQGGRLCAQRQAALRFLPSATLGTAAGADLRV